MTGGEPGRGRRIGIICDLGPGLGAGHFVRSSALGRALAVRGATVEIAADLDSVPWTRAQAAEFELAQVPVIGPPDPVALAVSRGWDLMVLDSYELGADAVAGLGVPLVAIDDDGRRPLPAILVVNHNLSGSACDYTGWCATTVLRGPRYALLRPQIAAARPASYRPREVPPARVLVLLGGTDPGSGAAAVAAAVLNGLAVVTPLELRVVAASPEAATRIEQVPVPAGSRLTVGPPVLAVEELMAWCDLCVSAAGSTIWELCCLGTPMALLVAAENQRENHDLAARDGIGYGLGDLSDVPELGPGRLRDLLGADLAELGRRAYHLVDGLGAGRVADRVLALP
jgi:spore coat polysaccharide biosynthesis predicted glycosyltransferase SpsG